MTREEFENFLLAVVAFASLMALVSVLRFRSKGISALLQCAAFSLFALGAWLVRGSASSVLQYAAFGGVAACLAADALVRASRSVDPPGEGK